MTTLGHESFMVAGHDRGGRRTVWRATMLNG